MKLSRVSVALVVTLIAVGHVQAQTLEWTRQFGTSGPDYGNSVSADGVGNVYLTGNTNTGLTAFVRRYNGSGNVQWTRHLGSVLTFGYDVSAAESGSVYISGETYGSLDGANAGVDDAFVSKYDAAGNLQWTRQLGTASSDRALGVSADGLGNVYMAGYTYGSLDGPYDGGQDAFVSKYDASGNLQWIRQFGTDVEASARGVSADGLGNIYVSGPTSGSLDGVNAGLDDVFVSKYDASGNVQWSRQLGTSDNDYGNAVAADGLGNVYISGSTSSGLEGQPFVGDDSDAFVSKFDASGNLEWTRQFGIVASNTSSTGVSADGLGNVYISGFTSGSPGFGGAGAGPIDAFVNKYDGSGNLLWTHYLGTAKSDSSSGVSADGLGNVYVSGSTNGALGGPNAGGDDAFVAKYSIPEPSPLVLLTLGGLMLLGRRFNPASRRADSGLHRQDLDMRFAQRAETFFCVTSR